jgi:hypothetical protein
MITKIYIPKADRKKFDDVLQIFNRKRKSSISVVSEDGGNIELEHENPGQLFILGRMYEPYKPEKDMGSWQQRFDNNYLNKF